ncbi:hypothetical protein [Salinivibrio sp. IB872]|uniref:hypothetical protein n=1 Tax=Salinivibrio sp. IB872 TaxID=1766123 RepID=UPI000985B0AE|nr:hypothetical protein [Salinivibrio sp. IB872]OOF25730.1 hypothetical protein BZJ18_10995 [Salinivibrio sp. IB872]
MTLPARKTKNPAIGVKRCSCGDVMTIHRATGTRQGTLYSICEKCGVDQRNGAAPQAYFADYVDSLEALEAAESVPQAEADTLPAPEGEQASAPAPSQGKKGASNFAMAGGIVALIIGLLAVVAKLKQPPQTV